MEEKEIFPINDKSSYDYGGILRKEVQAKRKERQIAEQKAKQMELHLQILQNENKSNIKQTERYKEKAIKRLQYLETFVSTQKMRNALKEQRFKELQVLKQQNFYIRNNLHKSMEIKRKDFFSKTNEEGVLAYTKKEYFKEIKKFNKNEELMTNKEKVNSIRNRTSNYQKKKHIDLINKKEKEIEYLENLLISEFQTATLTEVININD